MFKLNVIYLQEIKARRDWGKAMTFCSISWIHMDAAASTGTGPLMWGIFHRCQELCSPVRAFTRPHPGLSCQGSSDSSMWAHIPHLPIQFIACVWKAGAPVQKWHLSLNPSHKYMTPVSLSGQDNSSVHSTWELLGHFQCPDTPATWAH